MKVEDEAWHMEFICKAVHSWAPSAGIPTVWKYIWRMTLRFLEYEIICLPRLKGCWGNFLCFWTRRVSHDSRYRSRWQLSSEYPQRAFPWMVLGGNQIWLAYLRMGKAMFEESSFTMIQLWLHQRLFTAHVDQTAEMWTRPGTWESCQHAITKSTLLTTSENMGILEPPLADVPLVTTISFSHATWKQHGTKH